MPNTYTEFENCYEVTQALQERFVEVAKKAGLPIYDTGGSSQSCNRYVTLYDSGIDRLWTVRFSDHPAVSCASKVDHVILLDDVGAVYFYVVEQVADGQVHDVVMTGDQLENPAIEDFYAIKINHAAIDEAIYAAIDEVIDLFNEKRIARSTKNILMLYPNYRRN